MRFGMLVVALLLSGCMVTTPRTGDGSEPQKVASVASGNSAQVAIPVPAAWGGQVRCKNNRCLMAAVEHENGQVVLYQLHKRQIRKLDTVSVAYHPDAVIWLEDDLLIAAVEGSSSLDVFRVSEKNKLLPIAKIPLGFSPRDVLLVNSMGGKYTLLATPYSGNRVAWLHNWSPLETKEPDVKLSQWCEWPWHPVRLPSSPNGGPEVEIAVGCLRDKKIVSIPSNDPDAKPKVIATLPAVVRNVYPDSMGEWIYAALETGGKNVRVNAMTREIQWLKGVPEGSVSVIPIAENLVVWGEDSRLRLQKLNSSGEELEVRWYKTSGFSTSMQLIDVDGDAEEDVVVFNSAGEAIDIIYGPLWTGALSEKPI